LVEGRFLVYQGIPTYDVAPDGRFVVVKRDADDERADEAPYINVVLNWDQELLERVPVP
jgi:hypothetical protein